jgi:hypothetical protein
LGDDQFSFAPQIEINDHRPVGVSFTIGNGAPTSITTAFGNIIVTRIGDSGTSKGTPYVYAPDVEPYISNSGDLTREKIAKLVEMVIANKTAGEMKTCHSATVAGSCHPVMPLMAGWQSRHYKLCGGWHFPAVSSGMA